VIDRALRHRALALCALILVPVATLGCSDDPPVAISQAARTPTAQPAATGAARPPTETPAPEATATVDDPTRYAVAVSLDTSVHHPISPLIYGVADAGSDHLDQLAWLGATLVRWGGNARTRHNWEINASNTGIDGGFQNISQGDKVPGSASLQFLERNAKLGAHSLLTIPTIGWVARDSTSASVDVPEHGGPPVAPGSSTAFTAISGGAWMAPYDPAANRKRTSLPSLPRKDAPFSYPPDLTDGKVYQDEWVAYLRGARPADTAPLIYAMDNEPELWSDDTQVDVHPVRPGYDEQAATFLDYARAVKDADPGALVAGPESWGVTGYLYSALDAGADNFKTAADRAAHGNLPWLAWFLQTVHDSDRQAGRRSLDVLSVHYYPNGGEYGGGNDPATQDRRMQAPRALWDGLFVEPSWVARTDWSNLGLLPRLRKLIAQYYPGTRLAVSEWNYGGETDISGAIATADALGIYGREDVYYAAYWQAPPVNSPGGWAFRLFRNYDGNGAAFGNESVQTSSLNSLLTAYGALSTDGTRLTVLLINKDRARTADAQLDLTGFAPAPAATEYRYGPAHLDGIVSAPLTVTTGGPPVVAVPPTSMSLVVLDRNR
jgi:hypothetical protein